MGERFPCQASQLWPTIGSFQGCDACLDWDAMCCRGERWHCCSDECRSVFFGQSPQDHIPQSEVVCVLFRETVGASRYADRKIVTGTLQDVIDDTEAFLNRYIAVGARIEGWKRIDISE